MLPNWKFNNSSTDKSRISFLVGYLDDNQKVIKYFK